MSAPRVHDVDPRREVWREPARGGYPDPALFALSGIVQLERLSTQMRRGARCRISQA